LYDLFWDSSCGYGLNPTPVGRRCQEVSTAEARCFSDHARCRRSRAIPAILPASSPRHSSPFIPTSSPFVPTRVPIRPHDRPWSAGAGVPDTRFVWRGGDALAYGFEFGPTAKSYRFLWRTKYEYTTATFPSAHRKICDPLPDFLVCR